MQWCHGGSTATNITNITSTYEAMIKAGKAKNGGN